MVEKKLNECLKNDRARIQVGRISPFGLLEMSRQRMISASSIARRIRRATEAVARTKPEPPQCAQGTDEGS
jgi:Ribonuclease G/E